MRITCNKLLYPTLHYMYAAVYQYNLAPYIYKNVLVLSLYLAVQLEHLFVSHTGHTVQPYYYYIFILGKSKRNILYWQKSLVTSYSLLLVG